MCMCLCTKKKKANCAMLSCGWHIFCSSAVKLAFLPHHLWSHTSQCCMCENDNNCRINHVFSFNFSSRLIKTHFILKHWSGTLPFASKWTCTFDDTEMSTLQWKHVLNGPCMNKHTVVEDAFKFWSKNSNTTQ